MKTDISARSLKIKFRMICEKHGREQVAPAALRVQSNYRLWGVLCANAVFIAVLLIPVPDWQLRINRTSLTGV